MGLRLQGPGCVRKAWMTLESLWGPTLEDKLAMGSRLPVRCFLGHEGSSKCWAG